MNAGWFGNHDWTISTVHMGCTLKSLDLCVLSLNWFPCSMLGLLWAARDTCEDDPVSSAQFHEHC